MNRAARFFKRLRRRALGQPAPPPPAPRPLTFTERYPGCVVAGAHTLFQEAAGYFALPGDEPRVRVRIGADCLIDCQFVFESAEGEITIGDRCFINGGTRLIARRGITLGNDVMISWSCLFYDHSAHSTHWRHRQADIQRQIDDLDHGRDMRTSKDWSTVSAQPITIQDKVWIGFEAVVFQGVTIGEGAIVGARSIVTHDVEPWTVVAGSPARFIRPVPLDER